MKSRESYLDSISTPTAGFDCVLKRSDRSKVGLELLIVIAYLAGIEQASAKVELIGYGTAVGDRKTPRIVIEDIEALRMIPICNECQYSPEKIDVRRTPRCVHQVMLMLQCSVGPHHGVASSMRILVLRSAAVRRSFSSCNF